MIPPPLFRLTSFIPLALVLFGALEGCGSVEDNLPQAQASDFVPVKVHQHSASNTAIFIKPTSATKQCLAVAGSEGRDGAPVVVEPCRAGDAGQAWEMVNGTLRIFGDKCLDVISGRDKDGTGLQIWTCASNNINQKWTWRDQALQWKDHGRCLDLTDSNKQAGTRMQVWSCQTNNDNQKWRVSKAIATEPKDTDSTTASDEPAPATSPAAEQASNILTVKGGDLVDAKGNKVVLRGTNLGGWLVTENWMCGTSDKTDGTGRFARETLEKRFGEAKTDTLLDAWYDHWLTAKDLDDAKSLGINALRLPFGWRNLQHADGSWRKDASGNIDFSRMDWLISEAKKRNLYVILVFHIWDGQQQEYSQISGNSPTGKKEQQKAASLWEAVAKHYANNATVAAYDIINEPTGSAGNVMQDVLYKAVRKNDTKHPIVMESVSAHPKTMGWTNVIYSFHQYSMMGQDFNDNQNSFKKETAKSMEPWTHFPVPVYIGEFMAQQESKTLPWMIKQYNQHGWHWTSWTLKTVNMGSWGLFNVPGTFHLDVNKDSYDELLKKIKALPPTTAQLPLSTVYRQNINEK